MPPILVLIGCGGPPADRSSKPPGLKESTAATRSEASDAFAATFVDRASSSGLDFVHDNGMSGAFYPPEIMGAGAALFDCDGDGDLDAYLAQGYRLRTGPGDGDGGRLYRNQLEAGDLQFVDATASAGLQAGGYGMGVAAGDYDRDGRVDLYLTNFGPNRLLRNTGGSQACGFTDVTDETGAGGVSWSVPAVFFDYDRDGWLDLYVGNYLEMDIEDNQVCRTVTGRRDYCSPDVYPSAGDRLLRNLGGERSDGVAVFAEVTREAGLAGDAEARAALGAVAADFDGDGWLDLYVANDRQLNHLWINQRDGSFRDEASFAGCAVNSEGLPEASMGVAAADFDGDGDVDLFITHLSGETHTLYLNDGNGLFEDQTLGSGLGAASRPFTGFGTGPVDFDGDGRLDLLAVDGTVQVVEELARSEDPFPFHQTNQLFHNLGDGGAVSGVRFEDVSPQAGEELSRSETSRGAALGDVDNDGDTDVLISNNHGPVRLLVAAGRPRQPWLGIRLLSDLPVVGAKVALERRGAPTLWRHSIAGGSYASSSDSRLLFRLGDGSEVTRVTVWWPEGEVDEWIGLALGAYHDLRRGSGTAGATAPVATWVEIPHPDLVTWTETVRRRLEELRAEAESEEVGAGERARALGALGQSYMAYVLPQAAEACFVNAEALAPDDPAWPYYLGVLRQQRGDLDAAVESFERAAGFDSDDLATLVRLGQALLELDRGQAAQDAFGSVLELEPEHAAALYGLGRTVAREDPEMAIALFRRALERLPEDTVVHHALGQVLRRVGRLEEARSHLEREAQRPVTFPDPRIDEVSRLVHRTALDVVVEMAADPKVSGDEFLSFAVSRLGEVSGAVGEVERWLELRSDNPPSAVARLHLLAAVLQTREPDQAVAHLRAAVERDPKLSAARLRLGDAFASAGRYAEALEHYSAAVEVDPENRDAILKQATARVDLGRFAEALPSLRRLVADAPDDGRARLRLATALEGLGEDAVDHWQAALELELPRRERAFAWFGLANALGRHGHYDEAVAGYRSALELEPESTGAWLNLATLLEHLGRQEEAAAAYARLRELER